MAKNRFPIPLRNLLPQLLTDIQHGGRPTKEVMETAWGRVVGEKAAQNSWPRRLARGRLIVEVGNSGWMYTLSPMRFEILQGLIELLGAGRVKSLSFRIGEGKDA